LLIYIFLADPFGADCVVRPTPFTGGGKNATIVTVEGSFVALFISFPFTLGTFA